MRLDALMRSDGFAPRFVDWREPWVFRDEEEVRTQLVAAGFVDITTELTPRPTPFENRAAYRAFLGDVVIGTHLSKLRDDAERELFLDNLCMRAAADAPPYALDYVRLTVSARRPA